jgi:hypothetical protein
MRPTLLIRGLAVAGALSMSAVVLTACGSSSTSSPSPSSQPAGQPGTPNATEDIAHYAKRFEAAVATGQCTQLQTFAPGYFTASECAALLPKVHGLKVLATAGYGTGGVIDVTDAEFGQRGGTFVVEIGAGNKWTISNGYGVGHPTVGTTAKDASGFLTDLNGTIAAIRAKDCAAFVKYAFTATNGPSACTQPFASTTAKALTADPTAVPTSLGGNADFQFYSLALKGYPGHPGLTHLTWDVGKTSPGPGVIYPYVADPPRRVD